MLALASCGSANSGDSATQSTADVATPEGELPFEVTELGSFVEPWAMAFEPGTSDLFITEKKGKLKIRHSDGSITEVGGIPEVDYGGQGGFGDIEFAPDYTTSRKIYLSWVEAGEDDTHGAVVGLGKVVCEGGNCQIEGLEIIWKQSLKVKRRAHFSHRIAFSPDGKYLFISSGERAKGEPAQDTTNNLGTIVRLLPDGTPAPGNPFADQGGVTAQIWSYGHRNLLGLKFDPEGRLWDVEHGPAGGDEINLIKPGNNYGWPIVSGGNHYNGDFIPDHSTRPEFAAPAISWNPVIAPGNFIFYTGTQFSDWNGDALITGLGTELIVRLSFDGENATEVARYEMGSRVRDIIQAPDGAIWIATDGEEGKLLKLTPAA